ncbi:MAG: hypothetical protein HGA80_01155 [Candidatus Omnitrophica bacterium]|nr:hypothetical protein [Candidatus Omnitrophota bacterium]
MTNDDIYNPLARAWSMGQVDKLALTLFLACAVPFLMHALPFAGAQDLGQRWLPIYYAPLVAVICFRPHVSLLACAIAPWLNHAIFGMPAASMASVLTLQLLCFNAALLLLKRFTDIRGWLVLPAYLATLPVSIWALNRPVTEAGALCFRAMPGLLFMIFLAEILYRYRKGGIR